MYPTQFSLRTALQRGRKALAGFAASLVAIIIGAGVAHAGPVVLVGIDAEDRSDGGPGAHGAIAVYSNIIAKVLATTSNGGSGVLVIGAGKTATDDVTKFWTQVGTDLATLSPGDNVTFVNGATNITNASFSGFALIAVVTTLPEAPSGGLTLDEHNALVARKNHIATFLFNGGGVFGFVSDFHGSAYGYLGALGTFTVSNHNVYSNITPTPAGAALGFVDGPFPGGLDVQAWHDYYLTYPSFMGVLAFDPANNKAAAIGGMTNQPPVTTGATPTPDCIWPPNHKFVAISILGVTDANGDPVTITITKVTSDEATTAKSSGNEKHSPDAYGIGTKTAFVRAERSGTGDGRVYEITFEARDNKGGISTGSVKVKVPHDNPKTCTAIDSGQKFDATQVN